MRYLVDTCALSELIRPHPAPQVIAWFSTKPITSLAVSVLTLGEIRRGVEKLPDSNRRQRILTWLELELPDWFDGRILPVDHAVADEWGSMTARTKPPPPIIDGLIAATALHHRLTIITRNVGDFSATGADILNPWTD